MVASKQSAPSHVVEVIVEGIARARCPKGTVDPDITLKVFRELRENERYKRAYLAATGAETGLERGHVGKDKLNKRIAQVVKAVLKAEVDKTDKSAIVKLDGDAEFIEGYTRFKPR